jgi:hypothetical protein
VNGRMGEWKKNGANTREEVCRGRWRDGVVLKREKLEGCVGKSYLWELVPGAGKGGLA